MSELNGQLAQTKDWYDNPDKPVNIDIWGQSGEWWFDDLYHKDMALMGNPYITGQAVSHQPTSEICKEVSGCGVLTLLSAYDRPFFVMMRV